MYQRTFMNGLFLDVILCDVFHTSFDIKFHQLSEMSYTLVRVAQANSKCCKLKLTSQPLPPAPTRSHPLAQQTLMIQGLTLSNTPYTAGFLWTCDHYTAETSGRRPTA